MKRKIITINEDLCNGCGDCIPNCPEGALQIIDGKARLISDLFCDGLGACVGECPVGALQVIEREAEPYNEHKVMENIVRQGKNTIKAHLLHLKEHKEFKYYNEAIQFLKERNIENPLKTEETHNLSCPHSRSMSIEHKNKKADKATHTIAESFLSNWPIQMKLISPYAPYLMNADILLCADCVPFAYGNFHSDFVKNRVVIILCPKLDEWIEEYIDKFEEIIKHNRPSSITVVHMEVPCCFGIVHIAKEAIKRAEMDLRINDITVSINGNIKDR